MHNTHPFIYKLSLILNKYIEIHLKKKSVFALKFNINTSKHFVCLVEFVYF